MKFGANISKTKTSPCERLKDNPVYERVFNQGLISQGKHRKEPEEDDHPKDPENVFFEFAF